MSELLTRRGFVRDVAVAGAAVGALGFPRLSAANEVPAILERVFTLDREKTSGGRFIEASVAVNDDYRTHAVYSLQTGGQIQGIDFDPVSRRFDLRPNTAQVPIQTAQTIAGFPNHNEYGNEMIVVGGFNNGGIAAIAVSPDSGNTFEAIPLTDKNDRPLQGTVKEIKPVPQTKLALLNVGIPSDIESQYVLFDSEKNKFQLVSAATNVLPSLDNLAVNNQIDPSIVYGTGRMEGQGVGDFELDIEDAFIINGSHRFGELTNLDHVFVCRDDEGKEQEIYALQETNRHPDLPERYIYRIKKGDEENYLKNRLDYSRLDSILMQSLEGLPGWDEIFRYGVTPYLQYIHVFPQGHAWATGDFRRDGMQFPLAWHFETGTDGKVLAEEGSEQLFHPERLAFPSPGKEPKFVTFRSDNRLAGNDAAVYGVIISTGASTGKMLETDKNFVPLPGTEAWHQIPGK